MEIDHAESILAFRDFSPGESLRYSLWTIRRKLTTACLRLRRFFSACDGPSQAYDGLPPRATAFLCVRRPAVSLRRFACGYDGLPPGTTVFLRLRRSASAYDDPPLAATVFLRVRRSISRYDGPSYAEADHRGQRQAVVTGEEPSYREADRRNLTADPPAGTRAPPAGCCASRPCRAVFRIAPPARTGPSPAPRPGGPAGRAPR
jgi:hypothetical protein